VKTPEECTSLQDIRTVIDGIDHDIIALIARRRGYVKQPQPLKRVRQP
jgi:chorismate mutase